MPRLLIGPLLRHVGHTDATVWVEADEPCAVEILGHRERTWTVSGHHYALVTVTGLEPGSSTSYEVRLDGELVWPPANSARPPSRIRTLDGGRPLRLTFGSCRYGRAALKIDDKHFDADALSCLSRRLCAEHESRWPDALILLGDQVYADETSAATERRIRARRDITTGAKDQVADFEEYTWLYLESWTDPDVRWLFSTIPSSMIFDDHDVRDDWNTSHEWREEMQRTTWWQERIVGGLSSYWVYQHLGNLGPDDLAGNQLYQQVRVHDGDAMQLLRPFAEHADAEADGAKGTQWSYCRDFGRVRLLMIDSRCGRILADRQRSMVSEDEFAWIERHAKGEFDHLLVGTSLPWLLAGALHDLESWNEVLCDGARGARVARWSEKLRRAADLEHWAAFHKSFERLGRLIARVARGELGPAPATVSVLSGDVHHAYIAQAHFPEPVSSKVYQLTCSPLHNYIPAAMKVTFRIAWSAAAARVTRALLGRTAPMPPVNVAWTRLSGPYFGNEIGELTFTGRHAEVALHRSAPADEPRQLLDLERRVLSP
jgi:PhoD-like phosphatase